MSRRAMLIAAPLGLGALVLAAAAMAVRGEPPKPRPPAPTAAPRKAVPVDAAEAPASDVPASPRPVAKAAAPTGGGEYAVIEDRIRKMEEKLLALETKRNSLSAANQDLERQVVERNAEASARVMAEFRVRTWETLLRLSDSQKQALIDLVASWQKEDAGRPASRDAWLARESEVRSRLTAEQSARLHEFSTTQTLGMWNHLGRTLGSMAGAPKEDQVRFQQALGEYPIANAMLLPEGYGADWPGMMREGLTRLQPLLSTDQQTKLSRLVPK